MRYAVHRRDSVVVEMPSGESQIQLIGRTAYLSVAVVPSAPGSQITITVDSVAADPDVVIPPPVIDSAVGTQWTGRRLPTGRLTDLVPTRRSLLSDEIRTQLNLLYPVLPPEGVRPGVEWADSSTNPYRVSAFNATQRAVTQYRAAEVEDHGGMPTIQIYGLRASTLEGVGNQFGQEMHFAGTSSDSLLYHLGLDGRMIGGEGSESTTMTISVPAVGQTVPAQQWSRFDIKSY